MIKKLPLNFKEYKIFNKDYNIDFEINPNLSLYPGDFIRLFGNNGTGKTAFFKALAFDNIDHKPTHHICSYLVRPSLFIHSKSRMIYDSVVDNFYIPQNYEDFIFQGRTIRHFLLNYFDGKRVIPGKDIENIVRNFFENEKITISRSLAIRDKNGKPIQTNNLSDLLDCKMEMLSGGQKRLLYIIREFLSLKFTEVHGYRILMMDEPFNDIDLSNIDFLKRLINEVRSQFPDLIILISTHLQIIDSINRVFELIKGQRSVKISEITENNKKVELSRNRYI